ncbi:MAG: thiamine pyrophosphate-dependent dehydrogenase E1 component subunit alpha [Anaerolineae bacterium]|jgi:TPP-dependent pyruvate/acetoin dehydrogenase alpha subunit
MPDEKIPEDVALQLYETMQRIRKFELAVAELFARGKIPGFLHTYVGEEAVAAGVCAALRPDDKIISTHRGHGHLIAKGGHLDLMMAELFGKRTGYCKGKGGSMHIAEPELGMLGANAIVGAGIAIINGAALTAQYLGTDQVAVAFFGDGASNTGVFHEALNMASVWNLPSIFVCENNGYAESTPRHQHQKIEDIAARAKAYDMPAATVDGNDVGAVYLAAQEAVARARSGGGPSLIEAKTYRLRGHYEGDPQIYRRREEVEAWEKKEPVERWREALLERGISLVQIEEIEAQIEEELERAVVFAEESPLPDPAEARSDIFTPLPAETYNV